MEAVTLKPGLHLITNGNINDRSDPRQEFVRRLLTLQRLDSSVAFLAVASRTFSRKPDARGKRGVVIVGAERGTVSSSLLSLADRSQNSVYQYAAGSPGDSPYDDIPACFDRYSRPIARRSDRTSEPITRPPGED